MTMNTLPAHDGQPIDSIELRTVGVIEPVTQTFHDCDECGDSVDNGVDLISGRFLCHPCHRASQGV